MNKPFAAMTLAVAALVAAAVPLAMAGGEGQGKASPLDAMKKLAGSWTPAKKAPDGGPGVTATYRVTAGGSVVMETLFPGTDDEMITMYYMDGDDLMLTHFCKMGNQPRMKAEASKEPGVISFAFRDGTNIKSRDDAHMDSLKMTMADDDHLRAEWGMWKDGKSTGHAAFELVRAAK